MRDFSQIMNNSEKLGMHRCDEWMFRDFNNMVDACDMIDLKHSGNKFSWSGQRCVMRNS